MTSCIEPGIRCGEHTSAIAGTIVDTRSRPIAEADINVEPHPDCHNDVSYGADLEGEFRIAVPSGTYVLTTGGISKSVDARPGETARLNFTLTKIRR